jgi:hypothetical protein
MEMAGVIERDVNGRRTSRIALTPEARKDLDGQVPVAKAAGAQ